MSQMLTCGEVRHDPAVFFVERYLTVHPLAHQAASRVKYRDRRFITGTLEG